MLSIANCLGLQFRYHPRMTDGDRFELAVVALLEEKVTASGKSQSEFARAVIEGDSARAWRLCRTKNGKRRRLTLAEAYAAARFFGEDFASMMWTFGRLAKERGMID